MYIYCVKSFADIECYSDCLRRGIDLVEPLCYGVVCSAVTVECCVLYLCCVSGFGMFAVMEGRRLLSSVVAITKRRVDRVWSSKECACCA